MSGGRCCAGSAQPRSTVRAISGWAGANIHGITVVLMRGLGLVRAVRMVLTLVVFLSRAFGHLICFLSLAQQKDQPSAVRTCYRL
jgi:hypothetical protein